MPEYTIYNDSLLNNEIHIVKASWCEWRGGDSDGDGVCDIDDNCEWTSNPSQTDSDGDRIWDACDSAWWWWTAPPSGPCEWRGGDSDGDGVCDIDDNCEWTSNPNQADSDGDRIWDACDTVSVQTCEERWLCGGENTSGCTNKKTCYNGETTCGTCPWRPMICEDSNACNYGEEGWCIAKTRCWDNSETCGTCPWRPIVCEDSNACNYGAEGWCIAKTRCWDNSETCSACPQRPPVDLCQGIYCQDTIRTCAYGTNKSCKNVCSKGKCSECDPSQCASPPPPPPPPTSPDPVAGSCSTSYWYCTIWTPRWVSLERRFCWTERRSCEWYYGWRTDSCSITTQCPTDAQCGRSYWTCETGTAQSLSRSRSCGQDNLWTCVSRDWGQPDYCSLPNPCNPINGSCGDVFARCLTWKPIDKERAPSCWTDHTRTCEWTEWWYSEYCYEENECEDPCLKKWWDTDGDTVCDYDDNCPVLYNPRQEDSNNFQDWTGEWDACEIVPYCFDEWGDTDNDRVCDERDNCPRIYNPDQKDLNWYDDISWNATVWEKARNPGDACEALPFCHAQWWDDDNDWVCNNVDNCPSISNPNQEDKNWYLDDGWRWDACELVPVERHPHKKIGCTYCKDVDNDGVCDDEDYCPKEFGLVNNYGCPALRDVTKIRFTECTWQWWDLDQDGVCDYVDVCPNKPWTQIWHWCPSLQQCPEWSINDGNGWCVSNSWWFIWRSITRAWYICASWYVANKEWWCTEASLLRENNRRNNSNKNNRNLIGR